jgi:hypothetical protein
MRWQQWFGVTALGLVGVLVLPALGIIPVAIGDEPAPADREEEFSRSMANAVLVGSFTIDGKQDDEPLKAERYEIESVTKASDNLWIFTARVKYGQLDTKLPITVPMEWAGDTPVVTLTNASLPGLGDGFSARVLFYEDRYAGTWQHGPVGGHMFGKIERPAAK